MKRFFITMLFVCGLIVTHTASAQVKLGVVGGMNVSKVSYKDIQGTADSKTGWYIGPKAEFTIPIIGLGIDMAAEYSQRKLNANGENTTFKSIEVPINLRYQLGISLAKVYVMTGPQFGFQLGNSNWKNAAQDFELKKSNISWNVGAGVQLLSHLELGVGYNFALTKYAKALGVGNDASFKANTWQVQVAYLF
ncbi:MAG: porin family protein [Alistipes sp.]|nr:porin family protein [Candidatus Alistipes equi]